MGRSEEVEEAWFQRKGEVHRQRDGGLVSPLFFLEHTQIF